MKISTPQKRLLIAVTLASMYTDALCADRYAHTIFIPRQMAYNPIYEDALIFDEYAHMDR